MMRQPFFIFGSLGTIGVDLFYARQVLLIQQLYNLPENTTNGMLQTYSTEAVDLFVVGIAHPVQPNVDVLPTDCIKFATAVYIADIALHQHFYSNRGS